MGQAGTLAIASAITAAAFASFALPAVAAPYGPDADTPAQAATAGALDAIPAGAPAYAPLRTSLDALPNSDARAAALGQLSPGSYRLLPRLAIEALDASDRELRGYLAQRRELALDAARGIPTSGPRTITFSATGGVRQTRYDARLDQPRANSDSRSVRAALDITPVEGLIAGVSLGIDGTDANLDRAQTPRVTQFSVVIGPYASYTNGRVYAEATAAYGYSSAKLRRQVSWSHFSDRLETRGAGGDNAAATAEVGGIVQLGALRAQPFVGLAYRYADISGFVERGGPAALAVARFTTVQVRGSLGARTSATVTRGAWTIRPELSGQWQRELRTRPDSRVEAIFISGNGSPIFTLAPSRRARNAALVQAGIGAVHADRTAIRLGYAGTYAKDRRGHAVFASASRRF